MRGAVSTILLAVILAGCAAGGGPTEPGGASRTLEETARINNLFCQDSLWSTVFTGDVDATTSPSYPEDRSSIEVVWTPPSTGSWDVVAVGPEAAEVAAGVTLALPRCDADGKLVAGALAPLLSRQLADARTTIATFEITEASPYRLLIDVFQPAGFALHVFVRPTPAPPPVAEGADAEAPADTDAETASDAGNDVVPDAGTEVATDAGTDAGGCPARQTACGTRCVDLRTSATNCGACGHACAAGQTCSAGVCASPCGAPVSYSAQIQPIWNASCTSCHGRAGGVSLASGASYAQLVGVPSRICSGNLVVPGSPSTSILMTKLNGATCGLVMPPRGALPAATLSLVSNWICQGAPNN